jgi:hypothetical protein
MSVSSLYIMYSGSMFQFSLVEGKECDSAVVYYTRAP